MIPAIACLMLPFATNCSSYVRDVPRVVDVMQHPQRYSGKTLSVTGRVSNLDQWTSKDTGLTEEMFAVCDNGCIRVFIKAHSPIRNGQLVTVRGVYYQTYSVGRAAFHNEIEATEVLPRE